MPNYFLSRISFFLFSISCWFTFLFCSLICRSHFICNMFWVYFLVIKLLNAICCFLYLIVFLIKHLFLSVFIQNQNFNEYKTNMQNLNCTSRPLGDIWVTLFFGLGIYQMYLFFFYVRSKYSKHMTWCFVWFDVLSDNLFCCRFVVN